MEEVKNQEPEENEPSLIENREQLRERRFKDILTETSNEFQEMVQSTVRKMTNDMHKLDDLLAEGEEIFGLYDEQLEDFKHQRITLLNVVQSLL